MDLTMPARCPKGHVSTDPDYCSECGAKMPSAPSGLDAVSVSAASSRASASSVLAAAQSGSSQVCPDCGTPRATPTATFCEVCRYNYVTQTSWATPKVTNQPAASSAPGSDKDTPNTVPSVIPIPPAVAPPVLIPPVVSSSGAFLTPEPVSSFPADAHAASPEIGNSASASDASASSSNIFSSAVSSSNVTNAPAMSTTGLKAPGFAPQPDITVGSQQALNDSLPVAVGSPDGLTLAPIARWEARLTVDPSLNVDPDPALPCPLSEPERIFPLDFPDNLIGRRSEKRGIFPEINVNDPCSSHRHAKIQRQADGSFALLDVGSTNGTQLNGAEVQPNVLTPLKDGDQITLGCWTRIIIRGLRS